MIVVFLSSLPLLSLFSIALLFKAPFFTSQLFTPPLILLRSTISSRRLCNPAFFKPFREAPSSLSKMFSFSTATVIFLMSFSVSVSNSSPTTSSSSSSLVKSITHAASNFLLKSSATPAPPSSTSTSAAPCPTKNNPFNLLASTNPTCTSSINFFKPLSMSCLCLHHSLFSFSPNFLAMAGSIPSSCLLLFSSKRSRVSKLCIKNPPPLLSFSASSSKTQPTAPTTLSPSFLIDPTRISPLGHTATLTTFQSSGRYFFTTSSNSRAPSFSPNSWSSRIPNNLLTSSSQSSPPSLSSPPRLYQTFILTLAPKLLCKLYTAAKPPNDEPSPKSPLGPATNPKQR
mmetsp:Transcript_3664/g.7392  ORF Transcript_3664/g.7392 Transcript_3664/m.7392 type:complete len:342 (-) Transcript_3664:2438-3463(-)